MGAWGTAWHRLWNLPQLRSAWHVGETGNEELWPRLGKDQMQLMGARLCTHDTLFILCTLGQKFPKIPSSICARLIFHQAQTNT